MRGLIEREYKRIQEYFKYLNRRLQEEFRYYVVVDLDLGLKVGSVKRKLFYFLRRKRRVESKLLRDIYLKDYILVAEKGDSGERFHINLLISTKAQEKDVERLGNLLKEICKFQGNKEELDKFIVIKEVHSYLLAEYLIKEEVEPFRFEEKYVLGGKYLKEYQGLLYDKEGKIIDDIASKEESNYEKQIRLENKMLTRYKYEGLYNLKKSVSYCESELDRLFLPFYTEHEKKVIQNKLNFEQVLSQLNSRVDRIHPLKLYNLLMEKEIIASQDLFYLMFKQALAIILNQSLGGFIPGDIFKLLGGLNRYEIITIMVGRIKAILYYKIVEGGKEQEEMQGDVMRIKVLEYLGIDRDIDLDSSLTVLMGSFYEYNLEGLAGFLSKNCRNITIEDLHRYIRIHGLYGSYEPMLIPPKRWTGLNIFSGGHLLNRKYGFYPMVANIFGDIKYFNRFAHNTLNYLQSVSYCIDGELLDFLKEGYIKRLEENYLKALKRSYTNELVGLGVELKVFNYLDIRLRYCEKFWFAFELDSRGRIYAKADYSPTDSKLFRALLRLSNKYPLDINYLIYGLIKAHNKDGKRYTVEGALKRFKWEKHRDWRNNYMDAKDSVSYINYCIEYERYLKYKEENPEGIYQSNILISLDATSSGYQIITIMTGMIDWLKDLNIECYDDKGETMGNFYISIAGYFYESRIRNRVDGLYLKLKVLLSELFRKYREEVEEKEIFQNLFLPVFKEVLMKGIYGQTKQAYIRSMIDWYKGAREVNKSVSKEEMKELLIEIREFVNKLEYFRFLRLLRGYANLFVRKGAPIKVEVLLKDLQVGFTMDYKRKVLRRLRSKIGIKRLSYTYVKERGGQGKEKMRNALAPNMIHFLDALIIHYVIGQLIKKDPFVENYSPNLSLYTIHDCFLLPSNKIYAFMQEILQTYIDLFGDKEMLKQLLQSFKVQLLEIYRTKEELEYLANELKKLDKECEGLLVHLDKLSLKDNIVLTTLHYLFYH